MAEQPPILRDESFQRRFWALVERTDPEACWEWQGRRTPVRHGAPSGYGSINVNGRNRPAHRIAMMIVGHDVPADLVIDHLCRNPACVNPSHLRITTNRENVLCGVGPTAVNAAKTHCHNGHEFTPENTRIRYGKWRLCRQCARRNKKRHKVKYRELKRIKGDAR